MAIVELESARVALGYYLPGQEDDYTVSVEMNERLQAEPNYFDDFHKLLGVEVDFVGETETETEDTASHELIRFKLNSSELGTVYSTLFLQPEYINTIFPNKAISLIESPGQPLRAEKHFFRGPDSAIARKGLAHPLKFKDFDLVQSALAQTLSLR